jgi:hypothetical protein
MREGWEEGGEEGGEGGRKGGMDLSFIIGFFFVLESFYCSDTLF